MALQTQSLICGSGEYEHHYLCHYRSKSSGSDELSKSILQFKNGHSLHVNVWIDCAVSELKKTALKEDVVILRALGHHEEKVTDPTSLDALGKKLAETFHVQYSPSLLTKPLTRKLTFLNRDERAEEIFNQYSFSGKDFKEILIIDDILTTGATMCAIAHAIQTVSSACRIKIFTLATTNSNSMLNDTLTRSGFLRPRPAEGRLTTVQEDIVHYSEAESLRSKILNDSFK